MALSHFKYAAPLLMLALCSCSTEPSSHDQAKARHQRYRDDNGIPDSKAEAQNAYDDQRQAQEEAREEQASRQNWPNHSAPP